LLKRQQRRKQQRRLLRRQQQRQSPQREVESRRYSHMLGKYPFDRLRQHSQGLRCMAEREAHAGFLQRKKIAQEEQSFRRERAIGCYQRKPSLLVGSPVCHHGRSCVCTCVMLRPKKRIERRSSAFAVRDRPWEIIQGLLNECLRKFCSTGTGDSTHHTTMKIH
jgi:hypothetical protein